MLSHTSFNGSQLIRALEKLDLGAVALPSPSLAEGLSQWLTWTDAIALATALPASLPPPPSRRPAASLGEAGRGRRCDAIGLIEEFGTTRDDLARTISSDPLFAAGDPVALPDSTSQRESGWSALRRRYLEHQRAMQTQIASLRVKLRTGLSNVSPELASLAALDAVMDSALGARERHLLAGLPALLCRQFERRSSALASGEAPVLRHPELGQQMQAVLLAELEFRLQPLAGLTETLEMHTPAASKTERRAARSGQAAEQP